jgi:hypothetical protein
VELMSFFKDMTLARIILVLALLGSMVLGYTGWKQRAVLEELDHANRTLAPLAVQQIQQLSIEHTRLARELTGDQWIKETSPDSYIYRCGDAVGIGDMVFNRSTADAGVARGVTDQRSGIRPKDAKRQFDRHRIGQFLHRLEANSQRVRVTHAKIALVERVRNTSEPPPDWWTFEAEITTRVRDEDAR